MERRSAACCASSASAMTRQIEAMKTADRAGGGATVRPPRHPAARYRAHPAAGPQGLHHRLDRRAHGAHQRCPPWMTMRLHPRFHHPYRGGGPARDCRVPAHRTGAGGGVADGGGRAAGAAQPDPDGRPGGYPPEPDPGQRPGGEQAVVLVREQCHPRGAEELSRPWPQGLPGFPAHRFHCHEPGRHVSSHWDFYHNLAWRSGDAEAHRRFYDEYNAVLDMPAEYY